MKAVHTVIYSMGEHQCYAKGENKSIFGITNQLPSPWLPTVFHNFPESQMIQNDLGHFETKYRSLYLGKLKLREVGKIV